MNYRKNIMTDRGKREEKKMEKAKKKRSRSRVKKKERKKKKYSEAVNDRDEFPPIGCRPTGKSCVGNEPQLTWVGTMDHAHSLHMQVNIQAHERVLRIREKRRIRCLRFSTHKRGFRTTRVLRLFATLRNQEKDFRKKRGEKGSRF